MQNLSVRIFPDPILQKQCKEVDNIDEKIVKLTKSMIETMKDSDGMGLSAPQVGILKRIFVCRDFSDEDKETFLILINPTIIDYQGRVESKEGCLSIPGFYEYIYRYEKINMKALDINGEEQNFHSDSQQSIVFQHEFDHLNGILFPERMTQIKKEIFLKRINKAFK